MSERFWSKVDKNTDGDCWRWTARLAGGYGRFHPTRTTEVAAHRYAYELLIGPIPDGLTLDHTCHTVECSEPGDACPHRACVNPAHLDPTTMRENTMRSQGITAENARKVACGNGHRFEGGNLIVDKRGRRACRQCARDRGRLYCAEIVPCSHCGADVRRDTRNRHLRLAALHPDPSEASTDA